MTKSIKNVVFVHGAFADGSSWRKIIPELAAKGLEVRAVQNPLTSLEDDVAATRRVLDTLQGPTLLVGHSWAGCVISELGNHANVAGLAYIAAAAPDKGQSLNDWWAGVEPAPGLSHITPQGGGFLVLSKEGMRDGYAYDLPTEESDLLYAVQGPLKAACFDQKVSEATWRTRPSFYFVTDNDRIINSVIQHQSAKKMTGYSAIDSSHVPMLSHPDAVMDFLHRTIQAIGT